MLSITHICYRYMLSHLRRAYVYFCFTYNLRIRIFLKKRSSDPYSRPPLMYCVKIWDRVYGNNWIKKTPKSSVTIQLTYPFGIAVVITKNVRNAPFFELGGGAYGRNYFTELRMLVMAYGRNPNL